MKSSLEHTSAPVGQRSTVAPIPARILRGHFPGAGGSQQLAAEVRLPSARRRVTRARDGGTQRFRGLRGHLLLVRAPPQQTLVSSLKRLRDGGNFLGGHVGGRSTRCGIEFIRGIFCWRKSARIFCLVPLSESRAPVGAFVSGSNPLGAIQLLDAEAVLLMRWSSISSARTPLILAPALASISRVERAANITGSACARGRAFGHGDFAEAEVQHLRPILSRVSAIPPRLVGAALLLNRRHRPSLRFRIRRHIDQRSCAPAHWFHCDSGRRCGIRRSATATSSRFGTGMSSPPHGHLIVRYHFCRSHHPLARCALRISGRPTEAPA